MSNSSSHRRPIPLWQIAPLLLVPPVLVAGVSLYWSLPLTLFFATFALCCLVLLVLGVRSSHQGLAAGGADSHLSYRKRSKE
jgi:hypothetical protein